MTATQTVADYWRKDLSLIEAHLPMELALESTPAASLALGSNINTYDMKRNYITAGL